MTGKKMNRPQDNEGSSLDEIIEKIKMNPLGRGHYLDLAAALVKLDRYDQAIKAYYKANSLKEDYVTLYNIGSLYYKKNDFKNAIIVLEKSKLLDDRFYMTYLLTGICYGRLNNYRAAESNFIKVIMSNPENVTALSALAILYHNQGKINESRKILSRLSASPIKSVKKIRNEILLQSDTNPLSDIDFKNSSGGFSEFNNFIKSIPVSVLTDKYGTIEEKISRLESNPEKTRDNLISLSLCHLFSGNTESAIDYLIEAGSRVAV
jgi:tetratricopeptide (TPR) repeat protein